MRVQPHLPSSPLTAMVMSRPGAARLACSAANRPAPPAPRMRMSVLSSRMTRASGARRRSRLPSHELQTEGDRDQAETDQVRDPGGIDQRQPGGEQHDALEPVGALEQPALE